MVHDEVVFCEFQTVPLDEKFDVLLGTFECDRSVGAGSTLFEISEATKF
jgi:hypothetical protein